MNACHSSLCGIDDANHILVQLKNWFFLNIFYSYEFSIKKKKKNEKNFSKERENEIIDIHTSYFFFLKNFRISFGFYKFSYSIISKVPSYNRLLFFLNKLCFFKKLKNSEKNFSEYFFFSNFMHLPKKKLKKKIPRQTLDFDLIFLLTKSINKFSMNKKSCKKKNACRIMFSIKNLFNKRKKWSIQEKTKKTENAHKNFCFEKFIKIYSNFFFFPQKKIKNKNIFCKNFLQSYKKKINIFFLKFDRSKKYFSFFFFFSFLLNLYKKGLIRFTDSFLNYCSINILKKIISFKKKKNNQ